MHDNQIIEGLKINIYNFLLFEFETTFIINDLIINHGDLLSQLNECN